MAAPAQVTIYAYPATLETRNENGEVIMVKDPKFSADEAPKLIVTGNVALESSYVKDLIMDFDNPLVQVDDVTHQDIEDAFKFYEELQRVLGLYVPAHKTKGADGKDVDVEASRATPEKSKSNDEKVQQNKKQDEEIMNYLRAKYPPGNKKALVRVFQLYLTTNKLGSGGNRAVHYIGKFIADTSIKGKTPEQLKETFIVKAEELTA
jgi:hypothetical protein